jgi:hypothetical protein
MRLAVTTLAAVAALTAAGTERAAAAPARPSWLPRVWYAIGMCETGLNWSFYNSGFQGAFGFARSSWDAFRPRGYPSEAHWATPWQQWMVALRIYHRYGFSGWGSYGNSCFYYYLRRS